MKRTIVRSSVAIAGVCLAVGSAGLPADAAHSRHTFTTVASKAAPNIPSELISGFTNEAAGSGSIESLTLPALTCRADTTDAITVGVGNEAVDGQPVVLADVYVICDQGTLTYQTDAFVQGTSVQGVASPGDVISFSVQYKKHNKVIARTTNETNSAGTVTLTGKAKKAGLNFGSFPVYTDGTLDAVPTFDKFRFVKAFAAGEPLRGDSAVRIQRVNDGQTKIDVTDTIRLPPNEGSFSIVFKHN